MNKKIIGIIITILILSIVGLILLLSNKKYKVTFTNIDKTYSIKVKKNEIIKRPSEDPIKEGYTFDNWYLNDEVYNFDTKVTKNITLTANWIKDGNETDGFTVTFDSQGGTKVTSQSIDLFGKVEKPSDPIKEGYIFNYWMLNGNEYNFSSPVTVNIKLVANYTKIKTYKVTFRNDSNITEQEVNEGDKVTKPTDPTKSGYTFIEWLLKNEPYNFNTPVTSNITLVASWEQNSTNKEKITYTITFNSDGGTIVPSETLEYMSTLTKPTNPTKEGYTFLGWYLNNVEYDFSAKVTRNITLKAKWQ